MASMNAGFCGRLLRLSLGIVFLIDIYPVYVIVPIQGILVRLSWALGLLLFYLMLHFIILRVGRGINRILGAFIAFLPIAFVYFLGYGGPAATGALTFLSVALIIAAIRSDPGCEVMSIPALFTKRHTHLACLFFSPIDWLEKSFRKF